MSIPKYYEFYMPLLEYIKDGKVYQMKQVFPAMADHFNLSEEERRELLPSGAQTVLNNRVGWARTYLKKAGLVKDPEKPHVQISEAGLKALNSGEKIDNDYLKKFQTFQKFFDSSKKAPAKTENKSNAADDKKPASEKELIKPPLNAEIEKSEDQDKNKNNLENELKENIDDSTPDERFEEAFMRINENLAEELLNEVEKLTPAAFEQFAIDLMAKMGYGAFENAGKTTQFAKDGGIDGIIMEDKLGFSLIYLQAKKWNRNTTISRPQLQAFVGAIAGKDGKGLFVTTAKFSKNAIDYANLQHIILIDGEKLAKLMIEHDFGVSVKKTFDIKILDSDLFLDYEYENVNEL